MCSFIALLAKESADPTGQSLTLPQESEEVAGFFGAMLETDHARDPKFRENFFKDFKEMVTEYPPVRLSHHKPF